MGCCAQMHLLIILPPSCTTQGSGRVRELAYRYAVSPAPDICSVWHGLHARLHCVSWTRYDSKGKSGLLTLICVFAIKLTLTVLNFWKFTSYWSLKPLWSGMGEVVPARTSPTLHPPSSPTVYQLSWLALWELIDMLHVESLGLGLCTCMSSRADQFRVWRHVLIRL